MVEVCVKKYYRDVPSIRISEVNLRCHPPRKKPPFSAIREGTDCSPAIFYLLFSGQRRRAFNVGMTLTNCPVNCATIPLCYRKTLKN